MAEQANVVLVGARMIKEVVVIPLQHVRWLIRRTKKRTAVIYADQGSIFIFDIDGRVLHTIAAGLYERLPIERVARLGQLTILDIKLTSVRSMKKMNEATWESLIELTANHPDTQRRILALRVVHNP